jgi:hypothetical protein
MEATPFIATLGVLGTWLIFVAAIPVSYDESLIEDDEDFDDVTEYLGRL